MVIACAAFLFLLTFSFAGERKEGVVDYRAVMTGVT